MHHNEQRDIAATVNRAKRACLDSFLGPHTESSLAYLSFKSCIKAKNSTTQNGQRLLFLLPPPQSNDSMHLERKGDVLLSCSRDEICEEKSQRTFSAIKI